MVEINYVRARFLHETALYCRENGFARDLIDVLEAEAAYEARLALDEAWRGPGEPSDADYEAAINQMRAEASATVLSALSRWAALPPVEEAGQ